MIKQREHLGARMPGSVCSKGYGCTHGQKIPGYFLKFHMCSPGLISCVRYYETRPNCNKGTLDSTSNLPRIPPS